MSLNALVIDDSRATRLMLGRALRALGFEVDERGDAAEALELLQGQAAGGGVQVDLALVDRNMPGMDGLSFARAVRAAPALRELCLLMVSSETNPVRVMEAIEAGFDEYLMKPVSAEALRERLVMLGFGDGSAA
ncbi:MAG: Chemotaxis protein cheY [Pseudomonadota bacterium]|jgi:two-component system chemotaxis response regulator CheY